MNKQQIKQFIVDTLLPYKQDVNNCGYDENIGCVYLTEDGKKCAVGRHMVEGEWQQATVDSMNDAGFTGSGVLDVFDRWPWQKVLTPEAQEFHVACGTHARQVWEYMQNYHDKLAAGMPDSAKFSLEFIERRLEINLDELKY